MSEGIVCTLRTAEHKLNALQSIQILEPDSDNPWLVKITKKAEARSNAQNRLFHMWCNEISIQGREYTPDQVKQRSKYRYGIPILRQDEDFERYWQKVIPMFPTYEEIVDELMPRTPVTSIMSVKQMSQMLGDMQNEAGGKYKLTDPALLGLDRMRF